MRISIVFPYNTWGGAFRSTYELANRMAAAGESVAVYIPFFPYLEGEPMVSRTGMAMLIRGLVRSLVRRNRVPWFDLKVPLHVVPLISDRYLPDAEVVMANHWPTTASVAALSPRKGRKFLFVRDTDPWSPRYEREIASFRLPLIKIALAPWIRDFLTTEIGTEVAGVVSNGTNFVDFAGSERRENAVPTVAMIYSDHPAKGMADGLRVLERVKKRHPEVKILMFGWKRPTRLHFDFEFHRRPVKNQLRALYARSDIFLFPSLQEGSGNPSREAMAAGCALVTTNVGCIPECTIPGETAVVTEPGDVDGLTEGVCSLVEAPARRREMARRGEEHVQQFTWERSTSLLLDLLASGKD